MSDKKTKSVSLDAEVHDFLKQEDNASALVNDLVEQYRKGGDRHTAAIDLQIGQKERELEQAENKVSRLKHEIEELQSLKTTFEREENAELEAAIDALEGVPREPSNPAIENWAGNLGMTTAELIEELP